MKTLLVIFCSVFTFSSFAGVIAVCKTESGEQTITVVREDHSSADWESITLKWNRKDGRNGFRQFVNKEIKQNDKRSLSLSQNDMFLGMGQKTSFVLNKRNLSARLKGKVGGGGLQLGDGPHFSEPSGRFNIKFSVCEVAE